MMKDADQVVVHAAYLEGGLRLSSQGVPDGTQHVFPDFESCGGDFTGAEAAASQFPARVCQHMRPREAGCVQELLRLVIGLGALLQTDDPSCDLLFLNHESFSVPVALNLKSCPVIR